MHKSILPFLLIISLLFPLAAYAQEQETLSSLLIQIWPEYDQPSALVIYDMTLSADTIYPASLSIRIPLAAGEPNAVAVRQVDDTLYNVDYTRQISGDWAAISFTTTTPEVRLEYYDPELTKQDSARHYQYTWAGDYAVAELSIQVQQPSGATNMRISPSLGTGSKGSDNLTYYIQNIGAISAGQNIRITVDYEKPDDSLSVESLPVQPSAPIPQSTVPSPNMSAWLPWILGFLGAGLIIGGIIWYWQTGKQRALPQARRRHSASARHATEAKEGSVEGAIYCSQCGKRATPGDQFCRFCGAQIQIR